MSILTDLVKHHSCISIVGVDKNVGKTTVLCKLLKELDNISIGITSIGRDGESRDIVFGTKKPRIYIKRDTIFATAKDLLLSDIKCDITKEVLLSTNIQTPLGEIILARAKSDGYVDIAGPSYNKQIDLIIESMKNQGCEKIIIDGAISRIGILSSTAIDGTILVTGAALSPNIDKVIDKTKLIIKVLSLQTPKDNIRKLFDVCMENIRVGILDIENNFKSLELTTTLDSEDLIINSLSERDKYLFIKGIVTDKLLKKLIRHRNIEGLTIVVEDGTKIFSSNDTLEFLKKKAIEFRVINRIKIIGIAYNPYSPYCYQFNEVDFYNKLKQEINNIPIINVIGGEGIV